MYLIDTNVISEARKRDKANPGVIRFFERSQTDGDLLYVSVITVGEIRRGIELIRHRGDARQARQLESWIELILKEFDDHILDFAHDEAQVWGAPACSPPRKRDRQANRRHRLDA